MLLPSLALPLLPLLPCSGRGRTGIRCQLWLPASSVAFAALVPRLQTQCIKLGPSGTMPFISLHSR